jgi:hypothetical protein
MTNNTITTDLAAIKDRWLSQNVPLRPGATDLFVVAMKLTSEADCPAPVVRIHNGSTWSEIAPSFEEFLRAYAVDPQRTIFW